MEWVESTGSTIEEAKERALDSLGVHGDDAEFEVVQDVKKSLFGKVKEEARVRARVAPATPREKDERRGRGRARGTGGKNGGGAAGGGGNRNRNRGGKGKGNNQGQGSDQGSDQGRGSNQEQNRDRKKERAGSGTSDKNEQKHKKQSDNRGDKKEKTMSDEATMPLPEQADIAEDFVRGLAERFGTSVEFAREDIDENEIRVTVSGEDLGRMIGRRGTTAGAIDELVRTVLQRQAGSSRDGRIRVDIGGVRARRAEALANFSRQQADEVRTSGKRRSLEPMSAADRKVVHDALTDEDGVETISEGEDSRRRVVIVPTQD